VNVWAEIIERERGKKRRVRERSGGEGRERKERGVKGRGGRKTMDANKL
jgi:hypothetical protein